MSCIVLTNCTWPNRKEGKPATSDCKKRELPECHIVKKGETLWRISKIYNVPLDDIIRYNNIDDVTDLPVGKRIFFPHPNERRKPKLGAVPDFSWPVKGKISRGFKYNGPVFHTGIDIMGTKGTPIKSAASGVVIYTGDEMSGYGNMIIIKHDFGFTSVYAHNRVNLVKVGNNVTQGEIIAELGNTGRSTGPHLHFEIRKDKKPVDPLLYLH